MRREPHPLTGTIYEHLGDGKVKVQKDGSNSYGIFDWKGEWLEGEVTQADPLMLMYIGGPDLPLDHVAQGADVRPGADGVGIGMPDGTAGRERRTQRAPLQLDALGQERIAVRKRRDRLDDRPLAVREQAHALTAMPVVSSFTRYGPPQAKYTLHRRLIQRHTESALGGNVSCVALRRTRASNSRQEGRASARP